MIKSSKATARALAPLRPDPLLREEVLLPVGVRWPRDRSATSPDRRYLSSVSVRCKHGENRIAPSRAAAIESRTRAADRSRPTLVNSRRAPGSTRAKPPRRPLPMPRMSVHPRSPRLRDALSERKGSALQESYTKWQRRGSTGLLGRAFPPSRLRVAPIPDAKNQLAGLADRASPPNRALADPGRWARNRCQASLDSLP
jgi:hypothetical protein